MFKKHFLKILAGCLISAVLIYFAFRGIDFDATFEAIKSAKPHLLILAALFATLTYAARSVRYYFVILPMKKTRLFENFPYTVLGFFMNNIIPLRLGEFIRAKITGERLGISRSGALATIVVERILDIFIYVLFFFLIMNFLPFPPFIKNSFIICAIVFGLLFIVLLALALSGDKALNILSKLPLPLKIKNIVLSLSDKFIGGLSILKSKKALISSFFMSFVVWVIESMALMTAAYACGIQISLIGAIFTVIIIGISGIIPTAPGYIGAFEFAGSLALRILGVDEHLALACILIYHAIGLMVNFILGFSSVLWAKISFNDLFKFEEIGDKNA